MQNICGCVPAGVLDCLRDLTKFSAHVISLDDNYMLRFFISYNRQWNMADAQSWGLGAILVFRTFKFWNNVRWKMFRTYAAMGKVKLFWNVK